MKSTHRLTLAALLVAALMSLLVAASGCVGGRLDPRVAPIATVIEDEACAFVPASSTVGPISGPTFCKGLETLVNTILRSMSALPTSGSPGRVTVVYRGKVVARGLTREQGAHLTAALAEPGNAAIADAALGLPGSGQGPGKVAKVRADARVTA